MKQKIMKRFRDLTRAGVISIIVFLTAVLPLTAMSADSNEATPKPAGAASAQQDQAAELAKKAQNPVADLIIMPLQYNIDFGIGPADATQQTLKFMPVIPFSLGQDWNLIVRTIIPWIEAESPVEGGDDKSGLGDIQQSFFFTPKEPVGGWIIGAGPIIMYPSATDEVLGSEKWGAGPSFIALQQKNGWTYGMLANHIWSFAGQEDREEVNITFLQPFLAKTTKTYTTFSVNTESVYDWGNNQWTVPINFSIGQMIKIGKLPISLELGYRYYAEKPDYGPDWGLRFFVKFLFPK
jgi:hypothetical protein